MGRDGEEELAFPRGNAKFDVRFPELEVLLHIQVEVSS